MFERYFNVCIRRTSDGAIIPIDADNVDYQAYLAWESDGNVAPQYKPDKE